MCGVEPFYLFQISSCLRDIEMSAGDERTTSQIISYSTQLSIWDTSPAAGEAGSGLD